MGAGLRIKEALRQKKVTIKKLAEITDISVNTLYSITKRDPDRLDPVIADRISMALRIPICQLISEEEMKILEDREDEESKLDLDPKAPYNIKEGQINTYVQILLDNNDTICEKVRAMGELMCRLNESGQDEALKRVKELAQLSQYRKKK